MMRLSEVLSTSEVEANGSSLDLREHAPKIRSVPNQEGTMLDTQEGGMKLHSVAVCCMDTV